MNLEQNPKLISLREKANKKRKMNYVAYPIIGVIVLLHVLYSLRIIGWVKKYNSLARRTKTFHIVMIWLIPFAWGFLLKIFLSPAPGSHEIEKKSDSGPHWDIYNLE